MTKNPAPPRTTRAARLAVHAGLLLAGGGAGAVLAAGDSAPRFAEVAAQSGIDYRQHQLPTERDMQVYMAGGAAVADYDRDGWVDLYVTRLDGTDVLYRNKRDGTFEDVTAAAFGADHLSAVWTNGCAWGDIDNDGDPDLYVTSLRSRRYHLFINHGDGTFREEAEVRGAAVEGGDDHFGFSATFGDYDLDGYLDLHLTEWRLKSQNPTRAAHNTRLLRNRGAAGPGFFEDVTVAAGVRMEGVRSSLPHITDSQSFASRFCDLDRDGFPDLLIASDHRTSRLFWNNGDGTFTDGTGEAGVGLDSYGMGSTLGDADGDGDLDWFVTSIYEEGSPIPARDGNRLYRNEGNRLFSDATTEAGVRDAQWGWGASFFDFDHDGDLDLIATNGVGFWFEPRLRGYENDRTVLWRNAGGGSFEVVADGEGGVADTGSGKGLLNFDYDRDGDLDVFLVNNGGPPVLYRNETNGAGDWLKVRAVGRRSNRDGFGTRVTVWTDENRPPLVREIDGGSNFLGQGEAWAHFGLGAPSGQPLARVLVRWPGGIHREFRDVPRNGELVVTEPEDEFELQVTVLTEEEVLLAWRSVTGGAYLVQASSDLMHWRDVAEVSATAEETRYGFEPDRGPGGERYFRVARLQPR